MLTLPRRLGNASNAGAGSCTKLRNSVGGWTFLTSPIQLNSPLRSRVLPGTRILLAETEQENTLKSRLQNGTQPLALAFGPEGGWTEDEIRQFEAAGWATATLGATILRAETAIIAGLAITVSELTHNS